MLKNSDISCSDQRVTLVAQLPLFRKLDGPSLAMLARKMHDRRFDEGETIFLKGDSGDAMFVVLTGEIKITAATPEGREVLLTVMQPGEAFGEIACLDGHPRTASATALSRCELLSIARTDFLSAASENRLLSTMVIEFLCSRVRGMSEQVEDISLLSSTQRIAKALLYLARRSPDTGVIKVTQQQIGQMVGITREMANRQLQDLARSGILKLQRSAVVVLSRSKLAAKAGADLEAR